MAVKWLLLMFAETRRHAQQITANTQQDSNKRPWNAGRHTHPEIGIDKNGVGSFQVDTTVRRLSYLCCGAQLLMIPLAWLPTTHTKRFTCFT